jgi:hypothetical protein
MRAMMSDREERRRRGCDGWPGFPSHAAWQSENEARAIMAETEPIRPGYACADCMVLAPFNAPLGLLPEEREILADALRAFVEEE